MHSDDLIVLQLRSIVKGGETQKKTLVTELGARRYDSKSKILRNEPACWCCRRGASTSE